VAPCLLFLCSDALSRGSLATTPTRSRSFLAELDAFFSWLYGSTYRQQSPHFPPCECLLVAFSPPVFGVLVLAHRGTTPCSLCMASIPEIGHLADTPHVASSTFWRFLVSISSLCYHTQYLLPLIPTRLGPVPSSFPAFSCEIYALLLLFVVAEVSPASCQAPNSSGSVLVSFGLHERPRRLAPCALTARPIHDQRCGNEDET